MSRWVHSTGDGLMLGLKSEVKECRNGIVSPVPFSQGLNILMSAPERAQQVGKMDGEQTDSSQTESGSQGPVHQQKVPARFPWWNQALPFFLSAFSFLNGMLVVQAPVPGLMMASAFSVVLAPLPLLLVYVSKARCWAWLAILTNSAIVGGVGGVGALSSYFVFVVTLSVSLGEGLKRKKSIEKSSVFAFLSLLVFGAISLFILSRVYHFNPVQELQVFMTGLFEHLGQAGASSLVSMDPAEVDELKHQLLVQLPGNLAIFWLFLILANLALLLRFNPAGIRESLGLEPHFFRNWKAPEFLVWPVLVTGALRLGEFGWVSDVAINLFNFILAIYGIQGLSILGYFFDLWGIRGPFRWMGYVLSLVVMVPFILSLGFFDLWFDFRRKFRQS